MKLNSGIRYDKDGMRVSLQAMRVQTELLNIANENVNGFDKIGYQRKEAVVSSFSEYLGTDGISTTLDDKVGRLASSANPLDLGLASLGYFQTQSKDGVRITRDGRFKLDKNGNLLSLDDSKVLSNNGVPIKLPIVPKSLNDVVVNSKGAVSVFNQKTNKLEYVANIGVVDTNGSLIISPDVKQGFNEASNVSLEREFLSLMPVTKNFDANRQIFIIQSSNLTKTISQLSSMS